MNGTEHTSVAGAADSAPLSVSRLLERQKLKALCAFAIGIVLTMAYFALATRYYESEAKLFVKIGRQSVTLDPTATTGQLISVRESQNKEVFAVQELLASRDLAEAVVEKFGPEVILDGKPASDEAEESLLPSPGKLLEPLNGLNLNPLRVYSLEEKAVKAFRRNLTVLAGKQTSIISVTYESEDPHLSQDVMQALIDLGLEEHLSMHSIRGSQEFFVEQTDLLREKLIDLELQLQALKSETGFASLDTQRDIQLALLGSLRKELIAAEAEFAANSKELLERRVQLGDTPEMIVLEQTTDQPMTVAQAMREKLYDLEVQEEELASRYTESHPKLLQVRSKIDEARAIANSVDNRPSIKTGMNANFQAAQLALLERESKAASLEARIAAINQDIEEAQAKLVEMNQAEVSIKGLQREIDLATANYRTYSENLEQARINHEIEENKISSLNLMQDPTLMLTPASPKPSVTLGSGLVLSMILGALVAVRSEKKLLRKEMQQRTQATPEVQSTSRSAVRRTGTHESAQELVLDTGNGAS